MTVEVTIMLPLECRLDQLPEVTRQGSDIEVRARTESWFFRRKYMLKALPRKGERLSLPYPFCGRMWVEDVVWDLETYAVEVVLQDSRMGEEHFQLLQAELTADLWVRSPDAVVASDIKPPVPLNFIQVEVNLAMPEGMVVLEGAEDSPPVVIENAAQEEEWGPSPLGVLMDLRRLIKALAQRYVIPRPGQAEPSTRPEDLPAWPALWLLAAELREKYKLEV